MSQSNSIYEHNMCVCVCVWVHVYYILPPRKVLAWLLKVLRIIFSLKKSWKLQPKLQIKENRFQSENI